MAVIPAPFEMLKQFYPRRPNLTPELKRFMDSITGTPCCVQISHSLNMAGQLIPETYANQRRNNSKIPIDGVDYFYLLAVDELEKWLTLKYTAGELVSLDDDGKRRTPQQIKTYLQGRTGILVFRDNGFGFHTELWDGQQIVERDMNEPKCFSQPRVLFWDSGPPQWLTDYMNSL